MQPQPLEILLQDGREIRDYLGEAISNLELAIEAEHKARRQAKEASQFYQDAEAEFLMDLAIDGKNAEERKRQMDAALVKARNYNGLARPWAQKNAAAYNAEDAAMALEQASKRFSATRAAAELTAAMLNAAR